MSRWYAVIFLTMLASGIAHAAPRAVVVSNAWSRPANDTAVVYAALVNHASVSDRLVGASSPVARRVTLHETSDSKMTSMSMSMDDLPTTDSMTSMKSLSSIPVPARGTTLLKPGGYHLMLDLRHGIKAGQMIPLRLHFAHAGWIAANASVTARP